ncbi:MAG TPA: hypothetical protein VMP11_10805 [Verrucomicrobiae bacterium]|nr:hypothetical protein [Verrucomicrobiae bacterium]
MSQTTIQINRAPVLALWATVVAERIGFDHDEALTLAKAVTGLTAQSKGRRLGIFKPVPAELKKARATKHDKQYHVEFLGRTVPVVNTPKGMRALNKDEPIEPASVTKYLEGKFGDQLTAAHDAMRDLAKAFRPEELADRAFGLYAKFRPTVPEDATGWGAKGVLDLDQIRALATATNRVP